MTRNYIELANKYIDDVLTGKILACQYVKLACKRQKNDLKRKRWEYHFDDNKASRVCKFIELLTHVKGPLAGQNIKLEPWQIFILTTVFGWIDKQGCRRFQQVYIEVPRGNGKALDVNTLIPTPNGMVKMRDLKVGDIVFGTNGKPCNITAVTEVLSNRPCYKVIFNTGDEIIADALHQWVTDSRRDRDRLKGRNNKHIDTKPSVKTTEEIAKTLFCRKEHNHRIAVAKAIEGASNNLPIPPYILGVWLGDGDCNSSRISCHEKDIETIERIRTLGFKVNKNKGKYAWHVGKREIDNRSLQSILRANGLLHNKHIPNEYLFASYHDRLELLCGLMDTDGYISKGQGQCEFVQKKEALAHQVYQLICSLGLRPQWHKKHAFIKEKDCGIVYRILFHAYANEPIFKLVRKRERLSSQPLKRGLQNYRQIVSCEPVESVPVKCIEVDSLDHCYLAGEGFIPTHNSALSSGIALYMLCADGEKGADVYSFATTRDQAAIVFNDAQAMARANSNLKAAFGLSVLAKSLVVLGTNSKFLAKSADASTLDGLNTHCGIIDELHAHKTRDVFEVVQTSIGKRSQPLLWCITTAGFTLDGICMEVRRFVIKILKGDVKEESQFGIIYSLDEGDDWRSDDALIKANPNWGISVMPKAILANRTKALADPSAENGFKTKHLDLWCNADSAWMQMLKWRKCYRPDVEIGEFLGAPGVYAIDLAAKTDITAVVRVFYRKELDDRVHYYVFPEFWLPSETVQMSSNSQYKGWAKQELIHITDGPVNDLQAIQEYILDDAKQYDVKAIAFDPWQAYQLAQNLMDEGLPMVELKPTVLNFSEPMKELQALVYDKRLHTDGNPVLEWMVSNVVAHLDAKDNIYPRKEQPNNKIDGVVALIMAINRTIALNVDLELNVEDVGPLII